MLSNMFFVYLGPKYLQISHMLITSLLNGINSWNLAFRLIFGCRIRLCSRQFQIFKIDAHPWRHVVHLGPNYSQKLSSVNNFSIKWNKKAETWHLD